MFDKIFKCFVQKEKKNTKIFKCCFSAIVKERKGSLEFSMAELMQVFWSILTLEVYVFSQLPAWCIEVGPKMRSYFLEKRKHEEAKGCWKLVREIGDFVAIYELRGFTWLHG